MAKNGMASGLGMKPRKAMASGKIPSGASSVEPIGSSSQHPDMKMGTGGKRMEDGARGIGSSIHSGKGMHPAQASPDHGPTHPGGHMSDWSYGGKA